MIISQFAGITISDLTTNSPKVEEAGGYVSTHQPDVGNGQLSASVTSLEYGPPNTFGVIRIGWMVLFFFLFSFLIRNTSILFEDF